MPVHQTGCGQALPQILQRASELALTVKNVADVVALGNTTPKLAELINDVGERPTVGIIKAYLVRMNNNIHLPNGLTDDNIQDIAEYLVSDPDVTQWLTLADVRILCKRIEDGAYMRFNNRFGKDDFHYCLGRYCGERRSAHEAQHIQASNEYRAEQTLIDYSDLSYTIDKDGHIKPNPKTNNSPSIAALDKESKARQHRVANTAQVLVATQHLSWNEAVEKAIEICK